MVTIARIAAALAALLALTFASGAQAQRWGHSHSRVVIGVGVPIGWGYWPYWNYPPYGYSPYYPRGAAPGETVIYVEKGDAEPAPAQEPSQYWYFCRDSNTYFPYVKECATPWQRVVPHTPPR